MFSSPISLFRAPATTTVGRPVVYDGLERFHASRHDQVQCMPHVLSHEARPERRTVGVTRLGPNDIFMYFDLALSSHYGFFRASVRLARSLLEHLQLTRWSVDELVVRTNVDVAGRCTCVLWAASNMKLVRHDGRVRQPAGGRHVVRADPLCVRQEGLATYQRSIAKRTRAMTWTKVHLQSLCLAGALACRRTHLSVSTVYSCKICT